MSRESYNAEPEMKAPSDPARVPVLDAAPDASPGTLIDTIRTWAQERSQRPAIAVIGARGVTEEALTYSDLWSRASALADCVSTGSRAGRTILLAAPNSPAYVVWLLASLLAGAHVAPAHARLTHAELTALSERCGADIWVASGRLPSSLSKAVRRLSPETADAPCGALVPDRDRTARPAGIILQSSGTTGSPKLAIRSAASLAAVAMNVQRATALSMTDRVLACVPLCHSYGVDMLLATLYAGATLNILDGFESQTVAHHLARDGSSVFPGVPIIFDALARGATACAPTGLRLAFSAGGLLPGRVADHVCAAWRVDLGQLYGSTELGSVTFNSPDSPAYHTASAGLPMANTSIRVLDPDRPIVARRIGEEGHIAISSPSMLSGYVDDRLVLLDGHYLTGDLGYLDDQGRLFITGRIKLLIDVGGLKVNPIEVETTFAAHPGIADCAALALPLSDTVNKLRLVFVPSDPASPPTVDELRAFARDRLAPFKLPRVYEPRAALPRSPSGKLLRALIDAPSC